ncbi:ZYRO0G09680p [Zygosaccharomyces rouxii]|uniref:ZYRO0G09680p n=1 Tax=Zygosaccharomyces rouxii (strain ATCC 2623 / CBS 732 / NBRC 1130 / NCYC 568 / NRRL Y-229) TaxID=559307 RepID=C5E045_ZYGRC|nr:uncharacterized protein ZYRO0G09680g [Zygosaccharomyces rouxii]KAH9202474.1 glycoside hydrolase superfamily [Zygosaccharomyces rouxii]CAR29479.1 ZYRO0G09680p [Zygosaccharomyces rouxii]
MINAIQLLASLAFLHSLAAALPVKREIVTRMHTAPTHTNTDMYSTTTRIHVAPTVAYVVNGDVTYTTTLVPPNVDPTAEPVTSVIYGTSSAASQQPSQTPESSSDSWSSPAPSSSPQAASSTTQLSSVSSQSPSPAPVSSSESSFPAPATSSESSSAAPATSSESSSPAPATSSQSSSPAPVTSSQSSSPAPAGSTQWTTLYPSSSSSSSSSPATPSSSWTPASSSSAPSSSSSSASSSGGLVSVPTAISYTPYNDDSTCKSSDQVNADLQEIQSKGIHRIRVYGADCGAFENILPAATRLGMKVNQGLWIDQSGVNSIDDAVQSLIQYGTQNGWDIFDFITVGNEAINSGFCSVSDLISKIQSVKSQLRNAGYQGAVITSEPPVTFETNPQLCTDSGIDFVGVNPHSFFDFGIDANDAGSFVKGQVQLAQNACGNMDIFVTETGYPSNGYIIGQEEPTQENQRIAINSILEEMNNNVTILSFFNDKWKNPGPYGIEQWFGIESQFN